MRVVSTTLWLIKVALMSVTAYDIHSTNSNVFYNQMLIVLQCIHFFWPVKWLICCLRLGKCVYEVIFGALYHHDGAHGVLWDSELRQGSVGNSDKEKQRRTEEGERTERQESSG